MNTQQQTPETARPQAGRDDELKAIVSEAQKTNEDYRRNRSGGRLGAIVGAVAPWLMALVCIAAVAGSAALVAFMLTDVKEATAKQLEAVVNNRPVQDPAPKVDTSGLEKKILNAINDVKKEIPKGRGGNGNFDVVAMKDVKDEVEQQQKDRLAQLQSQLAQRNNALQAAQQAKQQADEDLAKAREFVNKANAAIARAELQAENASKLAAAKEKEVQSLNAALTALRAAANEERLNRHDRAFAAIEQYFKPAEGKQHPAFVSIIAEKAAERAAADVTQVVDNNVVPPVNNIQAQVTTLSAQVGALASHLKQQSQPEDVALILYDTKVLEAKHYYNAVRPLLETNPYSGVFENYRLGAYLAVNRQIDRPLFPLESDQPVATHLNLPPRQNDFSEEPAALNPMQAVFSQTQDPGNVRRRVVLVVSSDCKPIEVNNPNWNKTLAVDVVLIDKNFQQTRSQDAQLLAQGKSIAMWDEFCRARNGEVVVVRSHENSTGPLSEKSLAALQLRLKRLIRPRF